MFRKSKKWIIIVAVLILLILVGVGIKKFLPAGPLTTEQKLEDFNYLYNDHEYNLKAKFIGTPLEKIELKTKNSTKDYYVFSIVFGIILWLVTALLSL